MAIPTITILPSFGKILSQDEKSSDQTLLVSTTNVEDTQSVVVVLNDVTYSQQMANNSATLTFPSADLSSLEDGVDYFITASISNIYSESATTSYFFSVITISGGGAGIVGIQSGGVLVGAAGTINFAGSGIGTISVTDDIAIITVSGDYGEFGDS